MTFSILPNAFDTVTITRSIQDIGVSSYERRNVKDYWVEISLNIVSPMISTDVLDISIPEDELELYDDLETFGCQKLNAAGEKEDIDCQPVGGGTTGYFHVYFSPCTDPQYSPNGEGCPINTKFTLYLSKGIRNTPWIIDEYTLSCTVSSVSNDLKYFIDTKTSDIMVLPGLIATPPQVLEVSNK